MLLVVEIIGVAFMLTLMFVGVWGLVALNKISAQMRYRNYLLEKLIQNVSMLSQKNKE